MAPLDDHSMKPLIFLCVVAGAALVYLMSEASANTALFARNYTLLLYLGGGLALGLMLLIGYQLLTLRRKLRERVFGSKLTLRLMVVFALMALIPGGLVYAISFQFLQRSIDSWFEVRLDESLNRGIKLARNALESSLKELEKKAEAMANALASSQAIEAATLNRLREQHSVEDATLMTPRGRIIAQSGSEPVALLPDLPGPDVLRQVRQQRVVAKIEPIGEKGIFLRVMVPVNVLTIADDIRVLQVLQRAPKALVEDAQLVEAGLEEYQSLLLARVNLKRVFLLTPDARDAAHTVLGAGACLRAFGEALGAALRPRRGHARDREGRLLEAQPREEPRRVRRAHAVVQHDDAPDRRRHRGDGAQPAAAGERQDVPRKHPVEPHLGRAHVR
jgi:nitrogen fixation/metabolism regulation signal transduction histidine kinase